MKVPEPRLPRTIAVTSPAFADGGPIRARHTCAGDGVAPRLAWSGVPADAVGLALVVSDPDAPRGTFLHWLVTGLPPRDGGVAEGAAPGGREWPNSGGAPGWYPPCPPSGVHRYVFAVHALDAAVDARTSQEALDHLAAHTVAWGRLVGLVAAR